MKSIIQEDTTKCYLCGRSGFGDPLETHHVIGGALRKKADEDGLTVKLCGIRCHRCGINSAHQNAAVSRMLKMEGQKAYEKTHTHDEWMKRYGRNWL